MQNDNKKFDQIKYQNKYISKNYDRINLTIPKGQKIIIKELAKNAGESVNEYIYQAIKQRIENDTPNNT